MHVLGFNSVFAYPPRAVSSGCGFKGLAGRAVPLMEEDVVAAPSQCSRGRKRKAWEACERVTRETTKSLRQCGIDWLKSKQFVHHPLSSSSHRGNATYIAKCKDGTDVSGEKSHSVELTLDLIPDFMGSLVGFMYPLGGIKSGVNSIACARCGARIRERSR